jgi:hypothetical protein
MCVCVCQTAGTNAMSDAVTEVKKTTRIHFKENKSKKTTKRAKLSEKNKIVFACFQRNYCNGIHTFIGRKPNEDSKIFLAPILSPQQQSDHVSASPLGNAGPLKPEKTC